MSRWEGRRTTLGRAAAALLLQALLWDVARATGTPPLPAACIAAGSALGLAFLPLFSAPSGSTRPGDRP